MSHDSAIVRINRCPFQSIVMGGLIAGTIDIGAACLINKLSPIVILQAIASGVLGRASFHMGSTAAALGLVLQWAMSLLIAAIFAMAAARLRVLTRRWITSGLVYGVVIFFVMNFVVVPLSAAGFEVKFTTAQFIKNIVAMILFGLIIAFFSYREFGSPPLRKHRAVSELGDEPKDSQDHGN